MTDDRLDRLLLAVDVGVADQMRVAAASVGDLSRCPVEAEAALERAISTTHGVEGSLARVRCLVALGARVHASAPDECETAMHEAASCGYTEVLQTLLPVGGQSVLGVFNDFGFTPLHSAAWKGHVGAVRFLIEAGSDVNRVDESHIGDSALSKAVEEGWSAVVEVLLAHGADPTIPGWMQLTPLDHALEWDRETWTPEQRRIVELLEEHSRLGRDHPKRGG